MKKQNSIGTWYVCKRAYSSQGLIADEKTGATIAVSYDPKDAHLIAAAPELLAALKTMLRLHYDTAKASANGLEVSNQAEDAILKAKGKS